MNCSGRRITHISGDSKALAAWALAGNSDLRQGRNGAGQLAGGHQYPSEPDAVEGRQGIAKLWQGVLDSGLSDLDVQAREIVVVRRTAYETGTLA